MSYRGPWLRGCLGAVVDEDDDVVRDKQVELLHAHVDLLRAVLAELRKRRRLAAEVERDRPREGPFLRHVPDAVGPYPTPLARRTRVPLLPGRSVGY